MEIKKLKTTRKYKHQKFTLKKDNLKVLVRRPWARMLREGKIKQIVKSLKNGIHFIEPFVVNRINNKMYLIDGNHRYVAVERVICLAQKYSIDMDLIMFDNLSIDEEHAMFDIVNNTSIVSSNDKLKEHCWDSEFFKLIRDNNFPCLLLFRYLSNQDRNALPALRVLAGYLNRNNAFGVSVVYDAVNTLDEDDYDEIKKFIVFFKKIFGEPQKQNPFVGYNFFLMLAKQYYTESQGGIGVVAFEQIVKNKISSLLTIATRYPKGFHEMALLYNELYILMSTTRGGKRIFDLRTIKNGKQKTT